MEHAGTTGYTHCGGKQPLFQSNSDHKPSSPALNGYSAGKRTVTPMDTELMAVAADAAADNSSENLGSTYFCSLKKTKLRGHGPGSTTIDLFKITV